MVTLEQIWNSCIFLCVNKTRHLVNKLFIFTFTFVMKGKWHMGNLKKNWFTWHFVTLWTPPSSGELSPCYAVTHGKSRGWGWETEAVSHTLEPQRLQTEVASLMCFRISDVQSNSDMLRILWIYMRLIWAVPKFWLYGKAYSLSITTIISLKTVTIKESTNYAFGTNLATLAPQLIFINWYLLVFFFAILYMTLHCISLEFKFWFSGCYSSWISRLL